MANLITILAISMLTACAQSPKAGEAPASSLPTTPVSAAPAPVAAVATPVTAAEQKPEAPKFSSWKMLKGKLEHQPTPKRIETFKDKKTGKVTINYCSDYGDFSITQSKTEGEVGAGEVNLRHRSDAKEKLCAREFSGKTDNLNIGEGYFAGVAGDYILTQGADVGEVLVVSQIFSLKDGKEIYKINYDPGQEYTIQANGNSISATFYAQVKIGCELAEEGDVCWKKVLKQNKIALAIPMPDCKSVFTKKKVALTEPALVTAKARVANIRAAKIEFVPGKPTCIPEP